MSAKYPPKDWQKMGSDGLSRYIISIPIPIILSGFNVM